MNLTRHGWIIFTEAGSYCEPLSVQNTEMNMKSAYVQFAVHRYQASDVYFLLNHWLLIENV
jgi:hypothetical protein